MARASLLLFPALLACGATSALDAAPTVHLEDPLTALAGRTITVVRVEAPGMDTTRLRTALEAEVGQPLRPESVTDDARRLWAQEAFEDVRVDATRDGEGVQLVYRLSLRPRVGEATVRGDDDEPRVADLFRELTGGIYDARRVERVARTIEERLRHRGHHRAEAHVRATRRDRRVDLALELTKGPRFHLASLDFVGAEQLPEATLRSCLRTLGGRVNVPGGVWRPGLLETDLTCVAGLYFDRGMVRYVADEPEVALDDAAGTVTVRVPIHEGAVFTLASIRLEDDRLSEEDAAAELARFEPPAPGETFSRARLVALLDALAADREVEIVPETSVDLAAHAVALRLVAQTESRLDESPLDESPLDEALLDDSPLDDSPLDESATDASPSFEIELDDAALRCVPCEAGGASP